MKKIFTYLFIGSFLYSFAQLPVSQTAEKKRVVLEEFTGKTCGFCPAGHKIGSDMKAADPDNVFLINIHTGNFAGGTPNYRTDFGPSLDSQADVQGYPAGTINRRNFSGFEQTTGNPPVLVPGITAMGRGNWSGRAAVVKTEDAYVNVACEATVDVVTNVLTVNVEYYYTANSPESSNYLNVALTQDDILGPQSGSSGNPDAIDPETGDYIHGHMLRHLLTGQWGEEITTTTMGTLVSKTFTYTLPTKIGDVDMDATKLNIVTFITETTQNIINANGTKVGLANLPNALEAEAISLSVDDQTCSGIVAPKFEIRNFGQAEITTMDIRYSANGGDEYSYTWNGNILPGYTENVNMPDLGFETLASNDINVRIESVNGSTDDITTNNSLDAVVSSVDEHQTSEVTIDLTYDQYGSEVSFRILDVNGVVVDEVAIGTYVDVAGGGTDSKDITLSAYDCYTFELNDSYGDGGCSATITDKASGTVLHTTAGSGSYTFTEAYKFATVDANGEGNGNSNGSEVNPTSIKRTNSDVNFSFYPNPATDIINVNFDGKIGSIEVMNILGETISVSTSKEIKINNLTKGVYFIQLTDKAGNKVSQSFVKK